MWSNIAFAYSVTVRVPSHYSTRTTNASGRSLATSPRACTDHSDGASASTPNDRRPPGPGMVAGLPIWVALTTLQRAVRALRSPAPRNPTRFAETGAPASNTSARLRHTAKGIQAAHETKSSESLSVNSTSAAAGASARSKDEAKRISDSLRSLANDVDSELAALRAAVAEQVSRREQVEHLLDAARNEILRLEASLERMTKGGRHGSSRKGDNVAPGYVGGHDAAATALLLTELGKAQTRATAAERRKEEVLREVQELRSGVAKVQADCVLATAMGFTFALAFLSYLMHAATGSKVTQDLVQCVIVASS